jgi:hypothetical protein
MSQQLPFCLPEAGATVEIPDAGGVPDSQIPTDSEEEPESSAAQPGLPEESWID